LGTVSAPVGWDGLASGATCRDCAAGQPSTGLFQLTGTKNHVPAWVEIEQAFEHRALSFCVHALAVSPGCAAACPSCFVFNRVCVLQLCLFSFRFSFLPGGADPFVGMLVVAALAVVLLTLYFLLWKDADPARLKPSDFEWNPDTLGTNPPCISSYSPQFHPLEILATLPRQTGRAHQGEDCHRRCRLLWPRPRRRFHRTLLLPTFPFYSGGGRGGPSSIKTKLRLTPSPSFVLSPTSGTGSRTRCWRWTTTWEAIGITACTRPCTSSRVAIPPSTRTSRCPPTGPTSPRPSKC
jgi:hypothetical protein